MKGEVVDGAALLMTERDVVVTAIADLPAGHEIALDGRTITLADDVDFGHKFAITSVARGEDIVKYGEVIGRASTDIEPGDWVHTHNCESTRGRGDLEATTSGGEVA
ncbi:UxaA family hydrolase [Haladaptatus sp. DYSN1]|uniref:UxaA family hydrolase n=1 Tax=unclassified Haladaptatus TaxID=2622732 RepID=UPI002405D1AC|nr:UxaA family hydrolase [Haladaptatus sp. DYSN1]